MHNAAIDLHTTYLLHATCYIHTLLHTSYIFSYMIYVLRRNSGCYRYLALAVGILSRFFCPISKTSPLIAKTNFQITLVQGRSIRIWWIGFLSLCGVRRSPDWLISRPLRWLSCRHYSHSLLSAIRFAGSLDVPESRQVKAFYHRFVTENLGISYPLDRLPGGP